MCYSFYRNLIFIIMIAVLSGCYSASSVDTNQKKIANYNRTHAMADAAFAELEYGSIDKDSSKKSDSIGSELNISSDKSSVLDKQTHSDMDINEKSSPIIVVDKELPKSDQYPLHDGFPVWYLNPNYNNYIGAVGSSGLKVKDYNSKKRVATLKAQKELASIINIIVENELEKIAILSDNMVEDSFSYIVNSYSKYSSHEMLSNIVVMDEWLDEYTGELFIWAVINK